MEYGADHFNRILWCDSVGESAFMASEKCPPQDSFNKLDQSLKRRQTVCFLDHDPLFHIDSFSKQNKKCCCTCNNSKSANLDQSNNDDLTKKRPV